MTAKKELSQPSLNITSSAIAEVCPSAIFPADGHIAQLAFAALFRMAPLADNRLIP